VAEPARGLQHDGHGGARAAQLFARAEELSQRSSAPPMEPDAITSAGGGCCEARHHSHAATNDTTTEASCNTSRMSHPLRMEGQPRPCRLAQPGVRVLASAPC